MFAFAAIIYDDLQRSLREELCFCTSRWRTYYRFHSYLWKKKTKNNCLKWCWIWTVKNEGRYEDISTVTYWPLALPGQINELILILQQSDIITLFFYLVSTICTNVHNFFCISPNPCINWIIRTILLHHVLTTLFGFTCAARWVVGMTLNIFQPQQLSCRHKSAWQRWEKSGLWDGFAASLGWAESTPQPEIVHSCCTCPQ